MAMKAPVSEMERDMMNVIWRQGSATAADIQKALAAERPLKDSTVRTVLMRLEDKGYLRHELAGRTFVYSCLQAPSSIAARAVKQILDRFCHGSLESLLAGMVTDELVDPEELRKIADRLSKVKSSSKGRKKRK